MPDESEPAVSEPVELTVGQVAARINVTVRTLRHWDDIALARPSSRSAAGYRLYTETDLERLRRVVVYRELGLGLDAIRRVLDDPAAGTTEALRAQQTELANRIEQLTALSDDLGRMADAHERGLLMDADEQAAMFGPGWNPRWPGEARQRYGDTPEWQQFAERSASRDASDWRQVADASTAFDAVLADAMDAGVEPGTSDAEALVARHREVFSAYFPISRHMQVVLGRMYESDPAFAAHYDGVRAGLARWLRRIIDASARAHGIDPDTATWQ